jgi:hypothetical protein
METDVIFAYALENNDLVQENTERGYPQGYVYMTTDEGDWIAVDICDDEGDHNIVRFAPFDSVRIITSLYEEVDFEDVEIEG